MIHLNPQVVFPPQILVYELYAIVFKMESSLGDDLSSFHDSPCQLFSQFTSLTIIQWPCSLKHNGISHLSFHRFNTLLTMFNLAETYSCHDSLSTCIFLLQQYLLKDPPFTFTLLDIKVENLDQGFTLGYFMIFNFKRENSLFYMGAKIFWHFNDFKVLEKLWMKILALWVFIWVSDLF